MKNARSKDKNNKKFYLIQLPVLLRLCNHNILEEKINSSTSKKDEIKW